MPVLESDSFSHLMGLQSTIRTPLNCLILLCCLSPLLYNSPSATGLRKSVFKSSLNPSGKSNPHLSNCETVFILFVLVNAPWGHVPGWSWQKTQATPDLWHTSSWKQGKTAVWSTFLISFRKRDLRHGWPPGLAISTSPSIPPTRKHTQMLTLAGGNQTSLATRLFPGPVGSVV